MKNPKLTPKMLQTLDFARRNDGMVFAGPNHERIPGDSNYDTFKVPPTVLEGLLWRGLVTLQLSPEGGMAARLTAAGMAVEIPASADTRPIPYCPNHRWRRAASRNSNLCGPCLTGQPNWDPPKFPEEIK